MITFDEQQALDSAVRNIAAREYQRGLSAGLGIAEVAVNWLRMKGYQYTLEDLAKMIEARIGEVRFQR